MEIKFAAQTFPMLVGKDVFECQSEIRFPSPKSILNELTVELRVLSFN
jgi:hypothetical protein